MSDLEICPICRNKRLSVKQWSFVLEKEWTDTNGKPNKLRLPITSVGKMCKKCFLAVKNNV